MHRAHRVRAREAHAEVGVEDDHAVADARRVLELVVVLAEREAALGDHRARSGRTPTGSAARARRGCRPSVGRRLAGDDRDHSPAWRTGMHCTCARSLDAEQRRVALDDLAGAEGPGDERPRHLVDDRADEVHRVDGLAGGRAHLGEDDRSGCPSSPTTGASSRRSEKQRSASACHDAASRCTWRSDSPQSAVLVRACSKNVVTRRSVPAVPRQRTPGRCAKRCSPMRGEPGDVGDVGRRSSGTLTTTSGERAASSARSSASRARDDLVVAERVAERAQHARGVVGDRRARRSPAAASSLRDRVARRARARRPRARRPADRRYSGSILLSTSAPRWKSRARQLVAEGLRLAQRRALERGDDRERRAPVVQQLLDRLRRARRSRRTSTGS